MYWFSNLSYYVVRSTGREMHSALHTACTFRALDTVRSGTAVYILPYSLVTIIH